MIIFMAAGITPIQTRELVDELRDLGAQGHLTQFGGVQVIVVSERLPGCHVDDITIQKRVQAEPNVDKIFHIGTPYQLVNRDIRPQGSIVQTGSLKIGNGEFGVIAGPCTVENEQQTIETAFAVQKRGATALRGGAFKPRTSPYAFQGLKVEGLKILAKARQETGLAIVTEAMSPDEVRLVEEYGDVIQIGARNAQNYRLLEAAGAARKPVLLKRGFSTTLEEWLMSAEYVLAGGNDRIILCERGIRTFENYVRFTLPVAVIPAVKKLTHLPVIIDPSHAAGRAEYVPPISLAAAAAGADGLLVEVHPDPKHALCDGRQSLTFDELGEMIHKCMQISTLVRPIEA